MEALEKVLESGRFIQGENVAAFEEEFARYCGTRYGVGVGSGSDALYLCLRALGIKQGDEVITTTFTFTSTVDAIFRNGATPILADIEADTYTIDVEDAKKRITRRTKAVMPVHLYGHPAELDDLTDLCEDKGILLLEDAAQAHGAEYKSRRVGSFGIASCFSFYPAKNLGAYGDAGAIVTNDEDMSRKLKMLREYGQERKYVHKLVGLNSRLDEIQAAVLRVKLRHLDQWNQKRREKAILYQEKLSGLNGKIKLPIEKDYAKHVYHMFVISSDRRDALREYLRHQGIETGIHYPVPVHQQESYQPLNYGKGAFPTSEAASSTVLSLPMFEFLANDEVDLICTELHKFYSSSTVLRPGQQ
jgi:dTDP-4-amino-4,6-dideoxygalactose transaminase